MGTSKKIIAFVLLTSGLLAGCGPFSPSPKPTPVDQEVWNHFPRGLTSFTSSGVREHWVNQQGTQTRFEEPKGDKVVIKEIDVKQYKTLYETIAKDPYDIRYNPPYLRYMDFENALEVYPFYDLKKSNNIAKVSIEEGIGVNETSGLKIEIKEGTTTNGLFFNSDYLNAIFEDESVKAIEFDAKADQDSYEFTHLNSAKQEVFYQKDMEGWGITTTWQNFSFTREMYEDIASGGNVINFCNAGNVYIDNVRPVSKDLARDNSVTCKYQTMDSLGKITGSGSANDIIIKNAFTIGILDELKVWSSAIGTTVDYSTSIRTEGTRSLHISKVANSQLCFGVTDRIIDNLDDKGICFDILTTKNVSKSGFKKFVDRGTSTTNSDYNLVANKWSTVRVPKSNIRDCTLDYVFSLEGTDGTAAMDIFIDNIRPASAELNENICDFDDNSLYVRDSVYTEISSKYKFNDVFDPINHVGTNLRDDGKAMFWAHNPNGAAKSIALDYSKYSNGTNSLKFEIANANSSLFLFFNKDINKVLIPGDSVSFDVYSECVGNIQLGQCDLAGRESGTIVEPNKWTTVTVVKDSDNGDNFFRLHSGAVGSVGNFYIDNVRINHVATNGLTFNKGRVEVSGNDRCYFYSGNQWDMKVSSSIVSNASIYNGTIGLRKDSYLKVTKGTGYAAFYLSKEFVNQIGSEGFSFDLYSTIGVNSKTGVTNFIDGKSNLINGGNYQHPITTWTTYRFNKNNIDSDGKFLVIQGSSAGDFYFDNIKLLGKTNRYLDKGTYYTRSSSSPFVIETGADLSSVTNLYLDGKVLSSSKYQISGGDIELHGLTNGEHKLSYYLNSSKYSASVDNLYFASYAASATTNRSFSVTYGSQGYQSISGLSDARRVIFGNKSIAFELSGQDILIPDASLAECLETINNKKVSGSYDLFVISGDNNAKVTALNASVTLSGDATVKAGYQYKTDKTFGTFGYSSTPAGTNEIDLWDKDHLMEYARSGLEKVYEQYYSIPVDLPTNYFSLPNTDNRIVMDFKNCDELGIKLLCADAYIEKLCHEKSSIIGRSFKLDGTDVSVYFGTQTDLDNALKARLKLYTSFNCFSKLVLCDEPRYQNLTAVGEVYKSVKRCLTSLNKTNVALNVNLLPISAGYGDDGMGPIQGSALDGASVRLKKTYEKYLGDYLSKTGADAITYDIYPLSSYGVLEKSYTNLIVASEVAKTKGVELHVVTETFTQANVDGGNNHRVMSRDDMHYLTNMLMGFGVSEVCYFTYYNRHYQSAQFQEEGCMVQELYDSNKKLIGTQKTPVWYNVQAVSEEMSEFDEVILNFNYQACYMAKGTTKSANDPKGYNAAAYKYADTFDSSTAAIGNLSSYSIDGEYSMLTWLLDSHNISMYMTENCTDPQFKFLQTTTMKFKSGSYAAIYENGALRYVNLNSGELKVKLSSGNAVFIIVF